MKHGCGHVASRTSLSASLLKTPFNADQTLSRLRENTARVCFVRFSGMIPGRAQTRQDELMPLTHFASDRFVSTATTDRTERERKFDLPGEKRVASPPPLASRLPERIRVGGPVKHAGFQGPDDSITGKRQAADRQLAVRILSRRRQSRYSLIGMRCKKKRHFDGPARLGWTPLRSPSSGSSRPEYRKGVAGFLQGRDGLGQMAVGGRGPGAIQQTLAQRKFN